MELHVGTPRTWGVILAAALTTETQKPGQGGTKVLLTRFGPSLLCVRYRYDEDRREYQETVELVAECRFRESEAECSGSRTPAARARHARPLAAPAGSLL